MRDSPTLEHPTREAKIRVPLTEKLKSIPETLGIRVNEEPGHLALREEGNFEVRRYGKQFRAEISFTNLTYEDFRQQAFTALAGYIFGGNRQNMTLAMTAPVLQMQKPNGSWTMSFILPSNITLKNAPEPLNPNIRLREVDPSYVAVVTYHGNNTLEKTAQQEAKLEHWLKGQSTFRLAGPFSLAQYDAPFVIPFMKKNEIHVDVAVNAYET